MGMEFRTLESLTNRAKQRGYRQPHEGESIDEYRNAFADFMVSVDRVESAEIRTGLPQEVLALDPAIALATMFGEEEFNKIMSGFQPKRGE